MITFVLILFSYIGVYLNLDAPLLVSDASSIVLMAEHTVLLIVSWLLIKWKLRGCDKKILARYHNFFLIGYVISLFFLHYQWTPLLDPSKIGWGFDPLRYYYYATEIIRTGSADYMLNYQGVVFFYVWVMSLFGIDPLIILFFNTLFILWAILELVTLLCKGGNLKLLKGLAWLFLIPELLYFDLMASREILCMASATLFIVNYWKARQYRKWLYYIAAIVSLVFCVFIRPPMGMMAILVVLIDLLLFRKFSVKSYFVLTVLSIAVIVGVGWSDNIDSAMTGEKISETVEEGVSGENEARSDADLSGSSTTIALIPHNPLEYVVFGFIRSFAYIVPDPPQIKDPINKHNPFIAENMPNFTAILLFVCIPFLFQMVRHIRRLDSQDRIITLAAVVYLFAIGTSLTNLIHQRYRVVYLLFYFSAVLVYYFKYRNRRWKKTNVKIGEIKI